MKYSIKELREICQVRPEVLYNWLGKYFYQRISIYLTWLFINLGLRANAVTLLSLFIGLLGGVFLIFGTKLSYIIGSFLIVLFLLIDYSDGEVARYQKEPTLTGLFIELIAHYFVNIFMYGGLMIGIFQNNPHIFVLVIGLLTITSLLMIKIRSVVTWQVICVEHLRLKRRMKDQNEATLPLAELPGKSLVFPDEPRRTSKSLWRRFVSNAVDFDINIISALLLVSLLNLITPRANLQGFQIGIMELFFGYSFLVSLAIIIRALCQHVKYQKTEKAYQDFFINQESKLDFWF